MTRCPPPNDEDQPLVGGAHVVAPGAQHPGQGVEGAPVVEVSSLTGAVIVMTTSNKSV